MDLWSSQGTARVQWRCARPALHCLMLVWRDSRLGKIGACAYLQHSHALSSNQGSLCHLQHVL